MEILPIDLKPKSMISLTHRIWFLFLNVALTLAAFAEEEVFELGEERPSTFISDPTEVLDYKARNAMEEKLQELTNTFYAEVFVVIVPKITEEHRTKAPEWLAAWGLQALSILVLIDAEGNLAITHQNVDKKALGGAPINRLLDRHVILAERIGSTDAKVGFVVDKFCGELRFLSQRARKIVVDVETSKLVDGHNRRMRMIYWGSAGLAILTLILALIYWKFARRPRHFPPVKIFRRFGARSCAAGAQYHRYE